MTANQMSPNDTLPGKQSRSFRPWIFRVFLLLTLLGVSGIGWASVQLQNDRRESQLDPTLISLATSIRYTVTPSQTVTTSPVFPTNTPAPTRSTSWGTIIYTARENGRTHLWAYSPGDSDAVQLTGGPWDDRNPAVSPDGSYVAFTSRRSGHWDLHILDIRSGEIRQLSDTSGYEGHPTWSPDGLWLAFEAYYDGNFDIWIVPVDLSQDPIQLTSHPGADLAPNWDPKGRSIAFSSNRDGSPDIYLANLDQPDDRFNNLTNTTTVIERTPTFSADGTLLAYSAASSGVELVMVFDMTNPNHAANEVGQGRQTAWAPDGRSVISVIHTVLYNRIQVFSLDPQEVSNLPILPIDDVVDVSWSAAGMPGEIYSPDRIPPKDEPLLDESVMGSQADLERRVLIELPGVAAPHPSLSDAVDDVFMALKEHTVLELGWDFLKSLDNAFVGLNDPLPPGYTYNDWLYTGRDFAFNSAAVQAGWVEFIRQDFGGQTYWRVYVLAATQDGTLGEPLREAPWTFNTRLNGDWSAYDQGGSLRESIPPGYYVDFTQLASDFGFERLASLPNWRTFYHGTRFNEFVYRGGLTWTEAMLELYPESALVTPTPFRTPTNTPTRTPRPTPTPWWWRWQTPSATPTQPPTLTPTSPP